MRITIATLLLVTICFSTYAQKKFNYATDFKTILAKTKDVKGNLQYPQLLQRFQANDSTLSDLEMLALLIAFTENPAYKPYTILETERAIYRLNEEGKFKQACDTATVLLKWYPLSYQALEEKSFSFLKLGMQDSSKHYAGLVSKILAAMLYSGDGQTPESAFFALGPADGQHMIKGAGLSIGSMGSGADKNGNFVDILGVLREGSEYKTYFQIQHAVIKMFDGKSAGELIKETTKESAADKKVK